MTPIDRFRRGARARPFVYGHRGVRGEAPENTLAAFAIAADQGADGVECDVRVCATGQVVVIHDATLERVTGGADPRAVAQLGWDELSRVDVGEGQRVPLLSDVLGLARSRGLRVHVEMKHDAPSLVSIAVATSRLLRAIDPRLPVMLSSFDPRILLIARALVPRVPRALLVNGAPRYRPLLRAPRPIGAGALHVERVHTPPDGVRGWLAEGLVVNVWTVNDPREAHDLAALGVDGLITDVPGLLLAALG